jgi:hypothetical protein
MLPFPFVFFGKDLFQPLSLTFRELLIHEAGIVEDREFLAATITPKSTHFQKAGSGLANLTFLDGYCSHRHTAREFPSVRLRQLPPQRLPHIDSLSPPKFKVS